MDSGIVQSASLAGGDKARSMVRLTLQGSGCTMLDDFDPLQLLEGRRMLKKTHYESRKTTGMKQTREKHRRGRLAE